MALAWPWLCLVPVNGQLESGARSLVELTGLASALARADCVITGEGRTDAQALSGKVPLAVARAAHPTPTLLVWARSPPTSGRCWLHTGPHAIAWSRQAAVSIQRAPIPRAYCAGSGQKLGVTCTGRPQIPRAFVNTPVMMSEPTPHSSNPSGPDTEQRIGLFVPCFIDAFYSEVGIAMLGLLERRVAM